MLLVQLLFNSLLAASIYILLSFASNLTYATTKFFNVSLGIIALVGGYMAIYLTQKVHVPFFISIALGVVASGMLGVLLESVLFLLLRKKKASPLHLFIAALGIATAGEAMLGMVFSSKPQTLSRYSNHQFVLSFFHADISGVQVAIILSTIAISIFLYVLLQKIIFGKTLRAVMDDEAVAEVIGINTNHVIRVTTFVSCALAGLVGILVASDTSIVPTIGLLLFLKGMIAAIVGGLEQVYTGILGGIVLRFAENIGILFVPSEWKDAIAFAILLACLVIRPKGILSGFR